MQRKVRRDGRYSGMGSRPRMRHHARSERIVLPFKERALLTNTHSLAYPYAANDYCASPGGGPPDPRGHLAVPLSPISVPPRSPHSFSRCARPVL